MLVRRISFWSKSWPARRKGVRSALVFLMLMFGSQMMNAQCAMCRAVLESEGNVETAEGINNGIVYLMAIPYVLVAVLFYFVYQKMKN